MNKSLRTPRHFAIIGAGMAGISCARTLVQAGHTVTVFEQESEPGGRMASCDSPFGTFDDSTQYFTARGPRFIMALETSPRFCKRWSANTIQLIDESGQVGSSPMSAAEAHWVGVPDMKSLVVGWATDLTDLTDQMELQTCVTHIAPDALKPSQWQLKAVYLNGAQRVFSGFNAVLLALPSLQAHKLLQNSELLASWCHPLEAVQVAPCWTLMLAFPQAMQPGLSALGPQWNAARSTHHRIAWLARESSKPGRSTVERWTVQASNAWSQEHLHDDPARVQTKLRKAFAEVTGIHAEPAYVDSHRWLYAKTIQPLGYSHLWQPELGLGICGDWCLGHRVEDAFVSGLELALAVV